MRGKKLLAAFLLGVGLCFVPVSVYGEVKEWWITTPTTKLECYLQKARIDYIMKNPMNFLDVDIFFDVTGEMAKFFLSENMKNIDTKHKMIVSIRDTRKVFSSRSKESLLKVFKRALNSVYSYIDIIATDIDTDIVAEFLNKEEKPLGCFYQGEYHLWGK